MEDKQIPYLAYEIAELKHERTVKRLVTALIFSILLVFLSNAIWLLAWLQYDYNPTQTETITIDGTSGVANYVGRDGSINNGEDSNN